MTDFPDEQVRRAQRAQNLRDPDRPRSDLLRPRQPRKSRAEKLAGQRDRQFRYVTRRDARREAPTYTVALALLAALAKSEVPVDERGLLHPLVEGMFKELIRAGYDPALAAKRIKKLRRTFKDWPEHPPRG